MLRNPFHRGVVRSTHWGIETEGQHEALVDHTTWSQVQLQLSVQTRTRSGVSRS